MTLYITELDEYQRLAGQTALYPGSNDPLPYEVPTGFEPFARPDLRTIPTEGLTYVLVGLAGEVGEILNGYKKWMRGDPDPATVDQMRKELGDVLWYLARAAKHLDISLSDLATENIQKLERRARDGTIKGKGDR
jgi:NTP pyrophosphatase (non-canonical NTP hydrolase)